VITGLQRLNFWPEKKTSSAVSSTLKTSTLIFVLLMPISDDHTPGILSLLIFLQEKDPFSSVFS
jgi:hypothetical protein